MIVMLKYIKQHTSFISSAGSDLPLIGVSKLWVKTIQCIIYSIIVRSVTGVIASVPRKKLENIKESLHLWVKTMATCNIKTCLSVKNICRYLDFYDTISQTKLDYDASVLVQYFEKEPILNDYHHIEQSQTEYIWCDLDKCIQFERNNRNRQLDYTENKKLLNPLFFCTFIWLWNENTIKGITEW